MGRGVADDAIRQALISSGGWISSDIDAAFAAAHASPDIGAPVFSAGGNSTKYAGFWIRLIALMVDAMVISIPLIFLKFALFVGGMSSVSAASGSMSSQDAAMSLVASLISILVTFTYFILFTYYKGATPGKMLVGIQVRNEDLSRMSLGRVILRETVGRIVAQLPLDIGYIMVAFTDRKRGLHDMIAGSIVVYKDPSKFHTGRIVLAAIIGLIIPILSIIAIVGILSSVVLVSLNSTRNGSGGNMLQSMPQMIGNTQSKADDAHALSDLMRIRMEMETLLDTKTATYQTGSDCHSGVFSSATVAPLVADIENNGNAVQCVAHADAYALSVSLKAPTNGPTFCVDSTGATGYHGIDLSSPSPRCVSSQGMNAQATSTQ